MITFTATVTDVDWNPELGGWRCSCLKIPGASVRKIYVGGNQVDESWYCVEQDDHLIRWTQGEHPRQAVVAIVLTKELSERSLTMRWKKLAIMLPFIATILSVAITSIVTLSINLKRPTQAAPKLTDEDMSGFEMQTKTSPSATEGDTRRIPTSDSPSGSISSPGKGDLVAIAEDIEGKVVNIGASDLVWVVVYSHSANRYYPHIKEANVAPDGRWISANTVIGASDDSKNDFSILAIIADDSTQQIFHQYFQTLERQGMEELPTTLTVIDKITVKRR